VDRSWEYINRSQTHEIGTEAAEFPEKEYINGIFLAVQQKRAHQSRYSLVHQTVQYRISAQGCQRLENWFKKALLRYKVAK
jgi:hypothetical protein